MNKDCDKIEERKIVIKQRGGKIAIK